MLPKITIPEYESLGENVCGFKCPLRDNRRLNAIGSVCFFGWDGCSDENSAEQPGDSCPGPGEYYLVKREQIEALAEDIENYNPEDSEGFHNAKEQVEYNIKALLLGEKGGGE